MFTSTGEPHSRKAAVGFAARLARRIVEMGRALEELEGFRRNDDEPRKRTSAGSLAISAVAVQHHCWFCGGFIANRSARAAA